MRLLDVMARGFFGGVLIVLLDRTHGVTVRIVRLLEALAVDAVRTGKEQIDLDSLSSLRVSPQLLSMGDQFDATIAP